MATTTKLRSTAKPGHAALLAKKAATSVKAFRQELGLSRKQFARLTAALRALRSPSGRRTSGSVRGIERPCGESERLCRALMKIMKREHVGGWLDTPNEAFSGLKPLELVERGEVDRLWRMIFEVESPGR